MGKNRTEILNSVTEIYTKQGIHSVTMDDVSLELGISKKTLYHYFESKNQLVEQVAYNLLEKNQNKIQQALSKPGNAIDQLLEVVLEVNQIIKNHNVVFESDLKKFYPVLYQDLLQKTWFYV
ncbi:MAG: TetR/AcrR family transcriptional regulator [Bacteroidales bacterium]|nr:TetR/AcrR family transcriptional regulator [Bacteroidales bacterium]